MKLRLLGSPRRLRGLFCCLLAAVAFFPSTSRCQGVGYWHTDGNRILDAKNQQVRIAGVNWYGFESEHETAGGLYTQDYRLILLGIREQGFNTIRIPFSSQMLAAPATDLNIAYDNKAGSINGDLKGLDALHVLDRIIDYAGRLGLKVILDHHRSEAGISAEANGLWYTEAFPETLWLNDWAKLAKRYLGNPVVVGFDLHNEPHSVKDAGACWDCGGPNDWHLAAERAGDAVLAVNPELLIFVEGTDTYHGDAYWWGGNLEGVLKSPVVLKVPHHLVYSAHDYGPRETMQPWFNSSTSYASLSSVWTRHWAYISQANIAPVWVSEFGTTNAASDIHNSLAGSQGQWFESLIQFLHADKRLNWTYWALNGEDTYGLLDATYSSAGANATRTSMLASIATTPPANSIAASLLKLRLSAPHLVLWTLVFGGGFSLFFRLRSRSSRTKSTAAVHSFKHDPEDNDSDFHSGFASDFEEDEEDKEEEDDEHEEDNDFALPSSPSSPPPPSPSALDHRLEDAVTYELPESSVDSALLTAANVCTHQVSLSWTAGPSPRATYTLLYGPGPNEIEHVLSSGAEARSYLVTGLRAETCYWFQVKASSEGMAPQPSNRVEIETEPAISAEGFEDSEDFHGAIQAVSQGHAGPPPGTAADVGG